MLMFTYLFTYNLLQLVLDSTVCNVSLCNNFKYELIKFLPYTNVCIALHTQCFPSVCEKTFTGDSGGIQTHDLLLTSADVLTSRPPSLPDDDWPARIAAGSAMFVLRLRCHASDCYIQKGFYLPIN